MIFQPADELYGALGDTLVRILKNAKSQAIFQSKVGHR
jgi:hypothetical protein